MRATGCSTLPPIRMLSPPERKIYIASTFCAAELQVSREASMRDLELRIFGLVSAANTLITGWWKGRQLGLIRFLAAAARHNGAVFSSNGVSHRAWGLDPNSKLEGILRDIKDLAQFPCSLHLTAWKLGAWPVLMTGAQTTLSLGWVIRYLFDFARALPNRCEFHRMSVSSSAEEEEPSKKRKISKG